MSEFYFYPEDVIENESNIKLNEESTILVDKSKENTKSMKISEKMIQGIIEKIFDPND